MADPYDINPRQRPRPFDPTGLYGKNGMFDGSPAPSAPQSGASTTGTNLDANGQFQMPSVPDFARGAGYKAFSIDQANPSFNAARAKGNAVDFGNVVGKSSTVADLSAGPQRRAAQIDAGPGASGYAAANVGNPDARGLDARLKDLDSALFDLSYRGGGLNMRSKRELFGQLLGEKANLSKTGFEADNQRQIERGRLANEAGQTNAQLSEAAARRRSDVNQFNAQLGENAYQYDTTRQDNADVAAAQAPLRALEYAKGLQDLRITGDKYDVGRDQLLDKGAQDWIAAYKKQNPNASDDQAVAARAEVEMQGTGPVSPTVRAAMQRSTNAIEDKMNAGTPFLDDLGMGVARAPLSQNETDPARRGTLKPQDISYQPAGGFVGFAQKFLPGEDVYMATPAGMENDPHAPRAYLTQSEVDAQERMKNALRYRAARRSQNDQ